MANVHREVPRHVEHGSDPQPPTKKASPRRWPRRSKWLRERDWLEESWKASEQFLASLPDLTPGERETIRLRWLKEAEHYDGLWRQQRSKDYALRIPLVVGAATVPVLAGLNVKHGYVALVGLGVAIIASLDSLFQLGDRWRKLRQTANLMTHEGWCFIELTGPYITESSHKEAYRRFLDRLEELNATQAEGYLRVFDKSRHQPEHDGESKTVEPPKN
jgi:hypothetical protein